MNPNHGHYLEGQNSMGTCTTIAAQLLMGYHNYYSYRKLIPEIVDGVRFLDVDYGNLNFWPEFGTFSLNSQNIYMPNSNYSNLLGTTLESYIELYDCIPWTLFGLNQAPAPVVHGMTEFIERHSEGDGNTQFFIS